MRPISLLAEILNNTLEIVVYGVWFVGFLAATKYLTDRGEIPLPYPWIPAGFVVAIIAGQVLKPVRRSLYLAIAKEMARSRSRVLMEVGVWRLLRVAYRFWPQDPVTDFVGMAALHEVYDNLPPNRRDQLYGIVQQMETATGSA